MIDLDYPSSAASLFATAAREVPQVVWTWCSVCWVRTDHICQIFKPGEKVYICQQCGQSHKVEVK